LVSVAHLTGSQIFWSCSSESRCLSLVRTPVPVTYFRPHLPWHESVSLAALQVLLFIQQHKLYDCR